MINIMLNQKNFNVIYLDEKTVKFQINDGNFMVSFPDGQIKTYSSKEFSALQTIVLDESGINDSLNLAIFLLVQILSFLLSIIIKFILHLNISKKNLIIFTIFVIFPCIICGILSIIFYFYNYAYFKKMSQLFNIVKETDFKEENPELFNQLNFIYNFQYILLAFILIYFLLLIILLFIFYIFGQEDFKTKVIEGIYALFQITFAIFLLIAYSKQKNKITINEKEKEEMEEKEEEIEKDEEKEN